MRAAYFISSLKYLLLILCSIILPACDDHKNDNMLPGDVSTNLFQEQPPADATPASDRGTTIWVTRPKTNVILHFSLPGPSEDELALQSIGVLQSKGSFGEALEKVNSFIQAHPSDYRAFNLRASIDQANNRLDLAQTDLEQSILLNPQNSETIYNLSEVKFELKLYDEAKAGFLTVENDVGLGDIASYKVFLCDLYGGHEDSAQSELNVLNKRGSGASYYFANIAWCLYNKDWAQAKNWLKSADRIYSSSKIYLYTYSLWQLGYLPIPTETELELNPH